MIKYHYTECGLSNVFIRCRDFVCDDRGEQVVHLPAIGLLHTIIAIGIILHKNAMSQFELRFLRSEFGLSVAEFAKILHVDKSLVAAWESGAETPEEAVEILIRQLFIDKINERADAYRSYDVDISEMAQNLKTGVEELSSRVVRRLGKQPIEIELHDNGEYALVAA